MVHSVPSFTDTLQSYASIVPLASCDCNVMEAGVTQIMNDRSHAHPSPSPPRVGSGPFGPVTRGDGYDGIMNGRVSSFFSFRVTRGTRVWEGRH